MQGLKFYQKSGSGFNCLRGELLKQFGCAGASQNVPCATHEKIIGPQVGSYPVCRRTGAHTNLT